MNHPTTLSVGLDALMADVRATAARRRERVAQLPPREMDEQPPLSAWLDRVTHTMTDEIYMMRTKR